MIRLAATAVLIFGLQSPAIVFAWTSDVHAIMTDRALAEFDGNQLPLAAADRSLLVRASQQPDLMRPRELPELRDIEASRHYINLELLGDHDLPPTPPEFYRLLVRLSATPGSNIPPDWDLQSVGMVPYALVESTERLTAVFAQLRRRPADPELQVMVAYLAGTMAHYAQDLCQPLHTTIHHDGRAERNGRSPHAGFHRRVDRLPARMKPQLDATALRQPQVLGALFPEIEAAMSESHALVDEVYRLEPAIDRFAAGGEATSALLELVRERYERSVLLTADLLVTAWEQSASIEVPEWASAPTNQPR